TGFWIDHSRNPVLGATITLEAKYGTQLVSAAAIVVQIIGAALWTILAFALHHHFASPDLRDEYDAQVQVMLRNTGAADWAVWNILGLGLTWRGHKQRVLKKSIGIAAIPALVWVCFIVAGIFVGQIASNSYDVTTVLMKPGVCGYVDYDGTQSSLNGFLKVQKNISTVARNYARSCYDRGGMSAISCSVYPRAALEYNVLPNQPCPVPSGGACFGGDNTAVTLQTKALSSHDDFGTNAPKDDRMTLEYKATCAPLDYDFVDSITVENRTDVGNNVTVLVKEFHVGNLTTVDDTTNYPFSYAPAVRQLGTTNLYQLNSYFSASPHSSGSFKPNAPFNQAEGDLTFLFLTPNNVLFTEPVSDPMFATFDEPNDQLYGYAKYIPKRDVYVMACTEQYQICKPGQQDCTGWSGAMPLQNLTYWQQHLGLNPAQNATYFQFASFAYDSNIFYVTSGIADSLYATDYLATDAGSQPVPDNQWEKEAEGWFQTVLARMQYLDTVFANIPLSIVNANQIHVVPPPTKELQAKCGQQRIATPPQYQSYNFFALVFIAFFGIVVPGAAIALKGIHNRIPGLNPKGFRYVSYQAEGLMQLHRMALEGAGYKGWKETTEEVPRTELAEERLPQAMLYCDEGEEKPSVRYPRALANRTAESDDGSHSGDVIKWSEDDSQKT
ncbi:hypothetical protein K431DRAFT_234249, partial [Polychaeton citri CBS 116435]